MIMKCFTFFVFLLVRSVSAGLFLAKLSESDLKRVLLGEVEAAIGGDLHSVTKDRLGQIENGLRPTFNLLTATTDGLLDHDGVRYLLSRFFTQQHGWVINHLQSSGDAWNSNNSAAGEKTADHIPELLQEVFESRMAEGGTNFRNVVILASLIEHLIRDELRGKLSMVYKAEQLDPEKSVPRKTALSLMESFMILFIRGQDATGYDSAKLGALATSFKRQYHGWEGFRLIINEVFHDTMRATTHFEFKDIASMLEQTSEKFASYYEGQCSDIKSALLDIEDRRSGRARLVDFYKTGLQENSKVRFTESIDVLRKTGILDEVDPTNLRILIPNYVTGATNCVARTGFYGICCPNSCEALLSKIETTLGTAEAPSTVIMKAVEDPKAALENGFRGLSPWLKHRLEDLSQHHNDKIPLHGRLFSQWMHFVHPRDCVYPYVPGSVFAGNVDTLIAQTGQGLTATVDQMVEHISQSDNTLNPELERRDDVHEHATGMWSMEESLFTGGKKKPGDSYGFMSLVKLLLLVGLCGGICKLAMMFVPGLQSTVVTPGGGNFDKNV